MDILLQSNAQRVWQYLLVVIEAVLILFAVARLMSERRQPANTVAWLLAIILLPWVGVPVYILFGGRKLRMLAERKSRLKPVLPGLAPASESTRAAPVARIITSAGACPPVGGNRVRLITRGDEAFDVLSAQIRAATQSIHIITFILARDDTGRRLINLLAQKAREGVKVRLLLDAVGCLRSSYGFCQPLRDAGGEVCRFMPVLPFWNTRSSANLRNHRKIAVIDQHSALIGGHNLAREYMGPGHYKKRWRDVGALIEGPAAALLNEVFLADWSFASGVPLDFLHRELRPEATRTEGTSELQVVASGPDVVGDPLYESILSMVQEASRSIWIVTPYFIPDEVLLRTLMVKARTGHEVVLIIPAKSNHPVTDFARRHYLRELITAGVQVRLCGPGMLHSKGMVVDDHLALMGSANFDIRSLFVNFEIGVVMYTEADVRALKQYMEMLLHHSSAPGPRSRRRHRILGRVAEDLSRLLAPLL